MVSGLESCPLSPYLFILTAETLSNKIRHNQIVEGIRFFGNEIKVSQLADDTYLFCADLDSVKNAIGSVKSFGKSSLEDQGNIVEEMGR